MTTFRATAARASDDEPLSGSFSVSGPEEDIREVEAHWVVGSPVFSPIAYWQGVHLATVVFHFACMPCAIEATDWFEDSLVKVYEGEVREASAVFGNRSVAIKGVGMGEKEAAFVFLTISNATGGERLTETASEDDSPGRQAQTQAAQGTLEQQERCPDFDPTQLPWTLEGTPSLSGMSVVELEWTGYHRLEVKLVLPPEGAAKLKGQRLADFHLMVQSDIQGYRIGNGATSAVWALCNISAENVQTTEHLDDQFFQQGDWGVLKLRFDPLGNATVSAAQSAEVPASLDFGIQSSPLLLPISHCGPSGCEERE